MTYTATYSPEDNKLRLSASSRLGAETYARVKAAGFAWAPKQGIFVAPMWTPSREDLLLELAGEIGDEDTSLVERAEQRAERFEEYGEARAEDAQRARDHVASIADGIPLGQPILVGHHSERHARKDAEKIQHGMRRAVKLWETAQYWESRAKGAIQHAKHKELPAVRARRIKGLEADIRRCVASYTPVSDRVIMQRRWSDHTPDGPEVPHVYCGPKGWRGGSWVAVDRLEAIKAGSARWVQHYENRLLYEKAMLAEGGGLKAEGFDIQVGGRIQRRGQWFVVTKLNKRAGALMSVTVLGHWCSTVQVEDITGYEPPSEGDVAKVTAVTKQAPLCNFRTEGCKEATMAQWNLSKRCSDSYFVHTFPATETTGAYRQRTCHGPNWTRVPVFLTDSKVVQPPHPKPKAEPVRFDTPASAERPAYRAPEPTEFDAMRESLKAGVQVVSAPQLFPTPSDLARRMVEAAGIAGGERVLEPNVGTGSIAREIFGAAPVQIVAIEINRRILDSFESQYHSWGNSRIETHCADFLVCNGDMGAFDRIVMNPPFADGADIKHIRHALTMLKPGGRLVAICANGPRQREQLMPLAEASGGYWEDLPAGTFAAAGTGVNTALVVIEG